MEVTILKGKKSKRVLIIIAVIMLFVLGVVAFGYLQLNNIKKVELNKDDISLGIRPDYEDEMKAKHNKKPVNVTNILFLGIDKEEDAADSIIVLSIDEDNNKVKITSIMRDSYIDFEGQSVKKVNYAYHYAGPQYAIKTINENYDLNIKDYVKVSFEGLVGIVDAMGGVEISIKQYELEEMKSNGITKAGTYNLTGEQALGYSRIRHVGQYDYERTQRQRIVLSSLLNKVKSKGIGAYASVMPKILSNIETSISNTELIALGNKIVSMGVNNIEQFRLPLDDYKKDVIENGLFYLKWDRRPNVDALHKFIYGEDK
jgi:polyisoprenyl-teichoic acid--peptidoglycan teichoic acid transferase